jgi:hypothetical protein
LYGGAENLWVFRMEVAASHLFGTYNFDVAPRFIEEKKSVNPWHKRQQL